MTKFKISIIDHNGSLPVLKYTGWFTSVQSATRTAFSMRKEMLDINPQSRLIIDLEQMDKPDPDYD